MSDPTWNGSEWVLTQESDTVTPAEAPTNSDAVTTVPSNYLICERTGFRVPVDEGLVREWDGKMVRRQSWEPRHPQDFVRGVAENLKGSERPEQTDRFLTTNEVTADSL